MSEEADKAASAVDGGVKPASKPSGGAKPRKSGGGAKATEEVAKFEYGDIVLARLRGYPPWRECCVVDMSRMLTTPTAARVRIIYGVQPSLAPQHADDPDYRPGQPSSQRPRDAPEKSGVPVRAVLPRW